MPSLLFHSSICDVKCLQLAITDHRKCGGFIYRLMFALTGIDVLSVKVFHWISDLPHFMLLTIMIFMPTLGYWDQLRKMINHKTNEFFKTEPALILIFTNFLRFIYWKFEPFETYLLGQSIAVFFVQILLYIVSLYYQQAKRDKVRWSVHYPHLRPLKYFLKTKSIKSVGDFIVSLFLYGCGITLIFAGFAGIFGAKQICTVIILIANIVDTTVSLPQFIDIVLHHKIEGVSVVLIGQYLIGDVLKLFMFGFGGSPWPFIFGAALQTALDATIAVSFAKQMKNRSRKDRDELPL